MSRSRTSWRWSYEYLGEQTVKNIAEPVRVYRVAMEVPSPLVAEQPGVDRISAKRRDSPSRPKSAKAKIPTS